VKQNAAGKNSTVIPLSLPNIAELITYGEITLGVLRPVGCIATATDGHNCLAMLVRRSGENLAQFLVRLDQAIDKALTDDIYTDESTPDNCVSVHITAWRTLNPHPCQHGLVRTVTQYLPKHFRCVDFHGGFHPL